MVYNRFVTLKLTNRQQQILIGMILGDAYLQKTGKQNARIRLEHSIKQKNYLMWKASQFSELFQGKPTTIRRYNERFGKTYEYVRLQSNSSPVIGQLRQQFYDEKSGKKLIPGNIKNLLKAPIALAIWFMDDGYYYSRDKMSYIYLPNAPQESFNLLLEALEVNFSLGSKLKKKKRGWCLSFGVKETSKLVKIISPHIFESMLYKLPTK